MTCNSGRRHDTIDLHLAEIEVTMLRVERRTEIAVRITRNAATIMTLVLGVTSAGLWTLYQAAEFFG